MKKLVIIFGYNNTRVYDIERLKGLCQVHLDAEIMLCKEEITTVDLSITSHTLEVDLTKYDSANITLQMDQIDNYLSSNEYRVIGCLPFSDKGIPLGSNYAERKGLPHDKCETSVACIDKYAFRCLEKEAKTPDWYKKPFFKKIHSLQEAQECVKESAVPLFFKPVAEGNSRGCLEINSLEDLDINAEIIKSYLEQGIVVEECIKNCDEYSFDGVDGSYLITEKKTSQSYYRVETQHILPAPLEVFYYDRLMQAGKIVSEISGSENGAVHNELFLNKKTGDIYCVEPNRRPAGLKLWDWIATAYPGTNNWKAWINWACGNKNIGQLDDQKYFVGCRMLQAPSTGTVLSINSDIKTSLAASEGVCDLAFTKKLGQTVTNNLKDNSDFIGYIVCKSNSSDRLLALLDRVEKTAATVCIIG